MKNIVFILLFPFSLLSQSGILIQIEGQTNAMNGLVHEINLTQSSPEIIGGYPLDVKFRVTNQTGSDAQWTITQKRIFRPNDWTETLTWLTFCYSPNSDLFETYHSQVNPVPVILNGTSTTSDGTMAFINVRPMVTSTITTFAHYRYYLTDPTTHDFIDSVDLQINFTLSLNEMKTDKVLLYPNPAATELFISQEGMQYLKYEVFDQHGKIVLKNEITPNESIDIQTLKNGEYQIRILLPSGQNSVHSFVVNNH